MADDVENDDQWLYGENDENAPTESEKPEEQTEKTAELNGLNPSAPEFPADEAPPGTEPIIEAEEEEGKNDEPPTEEKEEEEDGEVRQNGDDSDKDLDDDSDDDVNVVIGDIKSTANYTALNIKRGGLLTSTTQSDKNKQSQPGKFSVEEFDQSGMINGVPATEYNLDSLEDKPWRKPGADITDYFNYGFNEDTWKAYCERQKRLRMNESGVGLAPMNAIGLPRGPMMPIMNDNSKYSGNFLGLRKAGPPPGRRMTGAIDVIGGAAQAAAGNLGGKGDAPKENVIQVMTADRREYSRKPPGFPDMSVPPPAFDEFQPEYGFNPEPEPFYAGYEPTQDVQWGAQGDPNTWTGTSEIKTLTPGPQPIGPPPHLMGPPMPMPVPSPRKDSPHRDRERERTRERDRERESTSRSRSEKPRDRERERSHRRERSRSRSRRHKSKSRSPSHRSHRKKKSRRHEDSD